MNEYYAAGLLCIVGLMIYEISSSKKVIRNLEKRLNVLAKMTGHEELSSNWVSGELKEKAMQLKREGKRVEAIKIIRKETQMNLVEAKQYVDQMD